MSCCLTELQQVKVISTWMLQKSLRVGIDCLDGHAQGQQPSTEKVNVVVKTITIDRSFVSTKVVS